MMKAEESLGRQRLMALRNHVAKQIADDENFARKFRMDKWADYRDWVAIGAPVVDGQVPIGGECGTTGCLFGHGVNVPELREAGLRCLAPPMDPSGDDSVGCPFLALVSKDGGLLMTDFTVDKMIKTLFGLSDTMVEQIFYYGMSEGRGMQAIKPQEALTNLDKCISYIDASYTWKF